jgi:UTP--glucose-1-phosphate uridylyltransferase
MSKRIRKAVFPVAGLGTRFLPATKTVPKEMLPIIDRPLIQYAVDEAIEAGCDTLVFVTNRYKHAVADYFDKAYELEDKLERAGKFEQLEMVRNPLPKGVRAVFVTQTEALGLGHAVLCAKPVIGDEPFAVILPDDLMVGTPGCLRQMVDAYERVGGNIICVQEVPREKTASYGIVTPGALDGALTEVRGLVEKPRPEEAPSTLAVVGRYILQPEILRVLDNPTTGAGGEIQLTDAMAAMIGTQPFHGLKVDATRYDCGDKAGFITANIALALARDDIGPSVRAFLADLD